MYYTEYVTINNSSKIHCTTRKLEEVRDFANVYLDGMTRRSGETYAEHSAEVATVLSEATQDESLLSVAMLHDVLVHPDGKELLQESPLSPAECALVEKAHMLRRLHIDSNTKDLDTVIDAFLEDELLLPLRMAHRLNDVRHLERFSSTLQRNIAHETLHMYTAIAGRLGMNAWRHEMEDICFTHLNPQAAKKLQIYFLQYAEMDNASLTQTRSFLEEKLSNAQISFSMGQRIKGAYSTYRKMILKKRQFEDLTDRLAIRILVEDQMDCYRVLAVVHAHMHPIPGKLKDYIGSPKENGYQSIHTVVYPLPGVTEQPIEIQIRTTQMHEECEFGSIAHDKYKGYMYSLHSRPARVNLFRNFQILREESRTADQFSDALRQYFREDHLAIFDAKNNLYHMKKPVSALDFICHAWPQRVSVLKDIMINGRSRPMDTALHDGDIVDPQFGRTKAVQREWMNACQQKKSKQVVRALCV